MKDGLGWYFGHNPPGGIPRRYLVCCYSCHWHDKGCSRWLWERGPRSMDKKHCGQNWLGSMPFRYGSPYSPWGIELPRGRGW